MTAWIFQTTTSSSNDRVVRGYHRGIPEDNASRKSAGSCWISGMLTRISDSAIATPINVCTCGSLLVPFLLQRRR